MSRIFSRGALLTLALALGMITVTPAYATTTAAPPVPSTNTLLQSKNVDIEADGECGHFTGTLGYWQFTESPSLGGRVIEYYFAVNGTLYNNCSGATVHLRSYWTPATLQEQTTIISSRDTTGSQSVEWSSALYVGGITNMHVLLCVLNIAGAGCAPSSSLPGT